MFFTSRCKLLISARTSKLAAVLLLVQAIAFAQGSGRLDVRFPLLLADDANITSILTQPDGKILVAGSFTTRGPIARKDIVRLNSDGSIDLDFNAGTGADFGPILSIVLQPDGKIFVGGYFNLFNGVFSRAIARLNSNGSFDNTFSLTGLDVTFAYDLDIQPDGKLLASASNLIGSSFIARFTSTGANDTPPPGQPFFRNGESGFRIAFSASENKIVASSQPGTNNQASLIKIAVTGGQDQTFQVPVIRNGTTSPVLDLSLIGNGRILVFGRFDVVNGVERKNIAIVNGDGSVDAAFTPATTGSETIRAASVQPNGKIVIAGEDFVINGRPRGNIARLNADGSIDPAFDSGRGANGPVRAVAFDPSSRILAGGSFFRYGGFPRAGIVRLKP